MIPKTKVCKTCKEEKESKDFTKNFEMKDNLKADCKICSRRNRKKKEKELITFY